jgi:membrane-bound lytic murein transglycosylase D
MRPALRRLAAPGMALAAALLGACAVVPTEPEAAAPAPVVAEPVVVAAAAPDVAPAPPPVAPDAAPGEVTISGETPYRSRLDPADDAVRGDLWERVRRGFAMPELDNDLVRKWEQWYAARPDYVQRMTERGGRYLFHIVEEVERRGMPSELALLPFVESAFNPQALSVARAAGMWQFMPSTGRDYELRQNVFRDDRRDVLASTRAALDYLQRLHDQFGDWQLALAAYNWGQGNVQRAVARNRRAGQDARYEFLRMPDETRNYVPKLQAVKNIVLRPAAFSLVLPALDNHPSFLSVGIERDIDVALAANLAGLPVDDFQALNPQHNKPVILAAGTPQVLLPYDNANRFLRAIERHQGPLATWTAWVAPKTLKPAEAAQKVGMSEGELRELNRIPPKMLVKAGSTLLVPRAAHATLDVTEHVAANATMALAPDGPSWRKVVLKAGRKGDSVAAVARRYRVSAAQVAAWNGVHAGASFRPGEAITVMLAAAPSRHPAAKAAPRKTAKPAARMRVAAAPARQSAR